ncbi:MAG: hypothetical protein KIS88_10240 [Anaerolineales bacterium]|nr:hypothetical protein [Anaerolineales bacterium]
MSAFLERWDEVLKRIHAIVEQGLEFVSQKIPRRAWLLAVVLLPSLLAVALPPLFHGKPITAFLPNSSDEIIYWREIKTFVEVGFGGGQYSTNEYPAQFAPSTFGSHGPAFVMLYGAIGKLFGWQGNSVIFLHLVLVPLGTLLALRLAQPTAKQVVLLLGLLLTWWPLQLYISTNMQEVLHMVMALVLAALFYRYLERCHPADGLWIAALLLLLIPMRIAWAFCIFPLVFLAFERRPVRALVFALLAAGAASLIGVLIVRYFYSPYPWFSTEILELLQSNWRAGLRELGLHFAKNLGLYFRPGSLALTALLRLQLFVLLCMAAAWLWRSVRAKRPLQLGASLFHVANLGAVLLFVLLFYDILDTRDYRMFIPPLLLSAVVLVFQNRLTAVSLLVLSNLLAVGAFVGYYGRSPAPHFEYDLELLQEVEERINPMLEFAPGANRWCNTIAVGKYGAYPIIGYPLTQVPHGFGITTILEWSEFVERPLLSKYVWLDSEYEEPNYGNPVRRLNLSLLARSRLGDLYLNPHAPCD